MTNTLFTKPNDLAPVTKARSVDINNLSASVASAFAKLPDELALKSGAVNFAADTGAVNAYAAALDPKVTAYADGLEVKLRITRANTGAATLNVNGLGAIAIKRVDGTPALAGDIPAGATLTLTYVASANAFYLPAVVVGTLNVAVAAAAQSVQDAAAQVQLAAGQAAAAATSAGQSQGYATNSSNSAQASATSAAASEASRIAADKRFLGQKAAAPATDNQGAALEAGAAYYDTTLQKIQVWNGAAWTAGIATIAGVSSLNGSVGDLTLKTVNGLSLVGAGDIVPTAIQRFARVANTQLVASDKSKWLSLSGTFTQTFDTVANLGQGWFVYLSNNGTGDITIPLSDGVASWVMYPGEVRLFESDGVNLYSVVLAGFAREFLASGTFKRPPGYATIDVEIWGAGGGGGGGAATSGGVWSGGNGGGGGGYFPRSFTVGDLPIGTSVSVTIGAGGTGGLNGVNYGNIGGNTTFGTYLMAGGGAGGVYASSGSNQTSGGTVAGSFAGPYAGGTSAYQSSTAAATPPATAVSGPAGGNGGGVSNTTTYAPSAGAGGRGNASGAAAGTSDATATTSGTNGSNGGPFQGGGGGGSTSWNNAAAKGGNGGNGGIASGGGGAGVSSGGAGGAVGGNGGNGGNGYAIIRGR